jgi:hypothetical protein
MLPTGAGRADWFIMSSYTSSSWSRVSSGSLRNSWRLVVVHRPVHQHSEWKREQFAWSILAPF